MLDQLLNQHLQLWAHPGLDDLRGSAELRFRRLLPSGAGAQLAREASSSLGVTKPMSLAAPGANSSQLPLNASVASPAVGNFSVSRLRSTPVPARLTASS